MKNTGVKKTLFYIVTISFTTILAFGQGESDRFFDESIRRQVQGDDNNRVYKPQPQPKNVSPSLSKEGKALLTPAEKDYADYKQFLKKSKTGIAKIFPDIGCNRFLVDANDQRCVQAVQLFGQGAYYSFRKKNNNDAPWFDIYFADGKFSVIKSAETLGFWADLGDLPIETLEKTSPELVKLREYQLPQTEFDLKSEKSKFENVASNGNQFLTSKIKVKLNTTYGLRLSFWTSQYNGGEDTDLLIVLRVIRENEDGSVTFIWRELQRKETSKLK